jgi:hypothetical protein
MTWRRYIYFWLAGVAGLCVLVALLNVVVDPYGLIGTREIRGLNVLKPAATTRTRIVKPVQGERAAPSTLILGNSRPEMGLDPESAVWSSDQKPVYNAGIPGASVYRSMRYGQSILAEDSVQLVIWGLDFADFLIRADQVRDRCSWPPPEEDWESRLPVSASMLPADGWRMQRLKDYAVSILSTGALVDSLTTITSQQDGGVGTRTALGFNPAQDYGPIIRAEGQHVLFAQKNAEMDARLMDKDWEIVDEKCQSSEDYRSVEEFLGQAKDRGIPVILFINPYHVDYLETVWRAGLWPLFEDWKRRLLRLAADGGAEALWDFSLLNDYTTEAPPPPGDRQATLHWFWEPAHYKAELGELMLREMLGPPAEAQAPVGVLLRSGTVDGHLDAQRRLAAARFGEVSPD